MPSTTYVLATDTGKVRALIGDRPVDGDAHFSDEELQVYLDLEGGDLRLAAATALDSWGAELAAAARSFTLGDYSETTNQAAQVMGQRARDLRETARTTPAFAIAQVAWDGLLGFSGRDILVNHFIKRLNEGALP